MLLALAKRQLRKLMMMPWALKKKHQSVSVTDSLELAVYCFFPNCFNDDVYSEL